MSLPESRLDKIWRGWQRDPASFFREGLGIVPSNQQLEGLDRVRAVVNAKWDVSEGKRVSGEVKELSGKLGVAIRSGHGTGKDYFLAGLYLWWLVCFPRSKGLVTAPNMRTLQNVLWSLFRRLLRQSKFFGEDTGWLTRFVEVQSDKLINKNSGGEGFVEARTANVRGSSDEQGEALAGRHDRFLLIAVDEASGVPDGVFRPIEGAQAGAVNFSILIGNPTRGSGYFYECFHKSRSFWEVLHWDTELSNLDEVSQGETNLVSMVDRYARKYGRDGNVFRVRVKGEFPVVEADVLIPRDWVLRAVDRDIKVPELAPVSFGVDVAYTGDDKSVILVRKGNRVESIREFHKIEPMALVGWVVREFADWRPNTVFVDTIGLGAGVYSRLREQGYPVYAVVVSEKARDSHQYGNLRNELWWKVREGFADGLVSIPDDEELIEELCAQKIHPPDSSGVIKVWSKTEMKRAGYESPNKADALCLTYAIDSHFIADPVSDAEVVRKHSYKPLDSLTGY